MNIIIPSLMGNDIRTSSDSLTDVNAVKVYILNTLLAVDITPSLLLEAAPLLDGLEKPMQYIVQLIKNPAGNRKDYDCYVGASETSIPNIVGGYHVYLIYGAERLLIDTSLPLHNELVDEHEPCVIKDRTIGAIKTTILAEDKSSQQIEFLIKEKYDGVSFLDETKKVFIDFIPVDKSLLTLTNGEQVAFLSDEILEKELATYNGEEGWLKLKWNVPFAVTKAAGTIRFAVSVTNLDLSYIWQTTPSSFKITENLGARPAVPVTLDSPLTIIADMQKDISELQGFTGYQMDNNPDNDKTLVLSSGSAEEVL